MIDWKPVQTKLGVTADGIPLALTYKALLTFAAHGRAPADAIKMASICATMFPKYGISDTPNRLAQFLATTSHETGDYTVFAENLNYTNPLRLVQLWPSRFILASAALCIRNPRALAEKVYGGRYGNRPGTADAYDFRGGGWIQTTFRANYEAAQKVTGLPLVEHPELMHDALTSIEPACAYWRAVGCNELADADPSGRRSRVRVNGGNIGMDDVLVRTKRLMGLLS